jgi:hypothetical protein
VGLKFGFQLFGNAKTGSEFTMVSISGVFASCSSDCRAYARTGAVFHQKSLRLIVRWRGFFSALFVQTPEPDQKQYLDDISIRVYRYERDLPG